MQAIFSQVKNFTDELPEDRVADVEKVFPDVKKRISMNSRELDLANAVILVAGM